MGISGKLQWYDGTNCSAIGAVREVTIGARTRRTTTNPTIATRKRYGSQITEVVPTVNFRYALQDFNLFTSHLVKTLEGSLTDFDLAYYDGQEYGLVKDVTPDTVEVKAQQGGEISVDVNAIAGNISKGLPTVTWVSDISVPPSTWRQTTVLNVSGVDVLNHFREWSFRVGNNAFADVTGNVLTPSALLWGKADYNGRIEIAKSITSFADELVNASKVSIQVSFKNRASSPVERCFTFLSVDLRQAEVRLPMDLVVHRIEWESNLFNISTVSG